VAQKETTETRLKKLLGELSTLQGKVSGIAAEAERLKQQRNKELSKEILLKLRALSKAFDLHPAKLYGEVQKLLVGLHENDSQYLGKITNKENPYGLRFKDKEEEVFIFKLFGNCLKPGTTFPKFLGHIAGRAETAGNIFFRKDGD